jgi:hypothetical protein
MAPIHPWRMGVGTASLCSCRPAQTLAIWQPKSQVPPKQTRTTPLDRLAPPSARSFVLIPFIPISAAAGDPFHLPTRDPRSSSSVLELDPLPPPLSPSQAGQHTTHASVGSPAWSQVHRRRTIVCVAQPPMGTATPHGASISSVQEPRTWSSGVAREHGDRRESGTTCHERAQRAETVSYYLIAT